MKSLQDIINEGLFNRGATIYSTDFENLKTWLSLVGSWGYQNIKNRPEQYRCCPRIEKFNDTISSVEIAALDDLLNNLNKAIENRDAKLKITSKQKSLVIWLGKYIHDKAELWNKDCDNFYLLTIKLAGQ